MARRLAIPGLNSRKEVQAQQRRAFLKIFEMLRFPVPETEYEFMAPERLFRFDFCWRDRRVAFEYEGGTWGGGRHTSGKGYREDCIKYDEAQLRGWIVIRATVDMVNDGTAWALLERALKGVK